MKLFSLFLRLIFESKIKGTISSIKYEIYKHICKRKIKNNEFSQEETKLKEKFNREEAIIQQFLQEYQFFYRLAYSYVRNEDDAMDIVQESVCKALSAKDSLYSVQYLKTWCCRIVINTATDLLRKRKKEQIGVEEFLLSKQGERDTNYENIEVMEMLATLKEKERVILILRYFEDMKLEDIARITSENVSTIKSRLYRALKQLKIHISDGT